MGILVVVDEDFESPPVRQSDELNLSLDGWEGPLDLLLNLARAQKVDLAQISILELVEQYLTYLAEARALKLEIAADYLVMAAWLAYLKSRLLLPQAAKDAGPEGAELAGALQFRLRRLEAIRAAAEALVNRPRLGRDVFLRGLPEPVLPQGAPQWRASLYEFLCAYTNRRQKQALTRVAVRQRFVWSLAQARDQLEKLAGVRSTGRCLILISPPFVQHPRCAARSGLRRFPPRLKWPGRARYRSVRTSPSRHFGSSAKRHRPKF